MIFLPAVSGCRSPTPRLVVPSGAPEAAFFIAAGGPDLELGPGAVQFALFPPPPPPPPSCVPCFHLVAAFLPGLFLVFRRGFSFSLWVVPMASVWGRRWVSPLPRFLLRLIFPCADQVFVIVPEPTLSPLAAPFVCYVAFALFLILSSTVCPLLSPGLLPLSLIAPCVGFSSLPPPAVWMLCACPVPWLA
ncbi:hypothetical protein U1Q18_029778 [Sarracenia purpurea var. burkii]